MEALVLTELLEQVESESDAQAEEEPAVASGCFLWASLWRRSARFPAVSLVCEF